MRFEPDKVKSLLESGVATGAFPGAVAMWGEIYPSRQSTPVAPQTAWAGMQGTSRNRVPVTPELVYDLASVTKVLCTTSLALIFHQRGILHLHEPLAQSLLVPPSLKGKVPHLWSTLTPAHLLSHQSGLRPWRPLYRLPLGETLDAPNIINTDQNRPKHRQATLEAILEEQPIAPPGQRTIYSDLNFILLGFLLEAIGGSPLDDLFQREIAKPLKLYNIGYSPLKLGLVPMAPTEDGFRYGGPVGHPEASIMGATPLGKAHDDNARWLGGVAGHAGLFGSAASVWAVAADWARAWNSDQGKIFQQKSLVEFLTIRPTMEDPGRPLGFNILSGVKSLLNSHLAPHSVGHLGYTGPSLWWDYQSNFIWLFLTNRVHPRAVNPNWEPGRYQGGPH